MGETRLASEPAKKRRREREGSVGPSTGWAALYGERPAHVHAGLRGELRMALRLCSGQASLVGSRRIFMRDFGRI